MSGTLIAESLRVDAELGGTSLAVVRVARRAVGDVAAGQPAVWTFLEFEIASRDAERLTATLEDALAPVGGWYCDLRSDGETIVVFSGCTFRYPRGDQAGRAAATDHGRAVGVPEAQLDWPV